VYPTLSTIRILAYGNLKPGDYKSDLTGLPDHAILTIKYQILSIKNG